MHFYLNQGCVYRNDVYTKVKKSPSNKNNEIHEKYRPSDKTCSYIKKYSEFFADLTLQEYKFNEYTSLEMAAGILAASRFSIRLSPIWP